MALLFCCLSCVACPIFHSLAGARPFVDVSVGDVEQFSKISGFLAIQIAQHIHEKIEQMILVGEKQTIFLKLTIAFVMFSNSSMLIGAESGIRL